MEALYSSETLENLYQPTWLHIPEDMRFIDMMFSWC
jgi:hypothetical protein